MSNAQGVRRNNRQAPAAASAAADAHTTAQAAPRRPAAAGNPRPNRRPQQPADPLQNAIFENVAVAPAAVYVPGVVTFLTLLDLFGCVVPLEEVDQRYRWIVERAAELGINLDHYRRIFGRFFRTHHANLWDKVHGGRQYAIAVGFTTSRYVRDHYQGNPQPVRNGTRSIYYPESCWHVVLDGMVAAYAALPDIGGDFIATIDAIRYEDEQAAETRRVEEHNRMVREAQAEERRVLMIEKRNAACAAMTERLTLAQESYLYHISVGNYMHARICQDEIHFLYYSLHRNYVF